MKRTSTPSWPPCAGQSHRNRPPKRRTRRQSAGPAAGAAGPAGQISLEAFARAWKRLQRPIPLAHRPEEEHLRKAHGYLKAFGTLWRDPEVPGELREEAAREIFERLDLWEPKVVAVYPRAEHAWLLGMTAKKSNDLVLVGARGFDPADTKCLLTHLVDISRLAGPQM